MITHFQSEIQHLLQLVVWFAINNVIDPDIGYNSDSDEDQETHKVEAPDGIEGVLLPFPALITTNFQIILILLHDLF